MRASMPYSCQSKDSERMFRWPCGVNREARERLSEPKEEVAIAMEEYGKPPAMPPMTPLPPRVARGKMRGSDVRFTLLPESIM